VEPKGGHEACREASDLQFDIYVYIHILTKI